MCGWASHPKAQTHRGPIWGHTQSSALFTKKKKNKTMDCIMQAAWGGKAVELDLDNVLWHKKKTFKSILILWPPFHWPASLCPKLRRAADWKTSEEQTTHSSPPTPTFTPTRMLMLMLPNQIKPDGLTTAATSDQKRLCLCRAAQGLSATTCCFYCCVCVFLLF